MSTLVHCSLDKLKKIRYHLFQDHLEHVVFLFLNVQNNEHVSFKIEDYYLVPSSELKYQHEYYVELEDDARAKVIKMAWDKKLSLGEIHSHPKCERDVMFSPSDLSGFQQFVPHVWWRLNKSPYLAIVAGQSDFDALAWVKNSSQSEQIDELLIDNTHLIYPTGLTLKPTKRRYSFYG